MMPIGIVIDIIVCNWNGNLPIFAGYVIEINTLLYYRNYGFASVHYSEHS